MWTQLTEVIDGVDAAALAVMGDFVPFGVAQALGTPAAATASTTRCACADSCRRSGCLLDIQVQAVERGFGHGLVHMFAQDGTLLATASQSCIVRAG
ncbi:MAG: hypothetical protein WKF58_17000 [Ilumatobacteraceae bacterium]